MVADIPSEDKTIFAKRRTACRYAQPEEIAWNFELLFAGKPVHDRSDLPVDGGLLIKPSLQLLDESFRAPNFFGSVPTSCAAAQPNSTG